MCTEYQGKLTSAGYGRVRYKGKMQLVHRLSYCKANNIPIESILGKVIRHTCDNPKCYNPEHLLIGTQEDNIQDMVQRNRNVNVHGTDSPNAKLDADAVGYIRKMYKKGSRLYGFRALGRKFNVSDVSIANVINNKTWGSI